MMHKTMEDYMDDTLAKRMQHKTHLGDLGPILDRMEQSSLQLNPKKCAFRVTSGKFLGYVISMKSIEVDPKNVQAIMEIPPPRNIK